MNPGPLSFKTSTVPIEIKDVTQFIFRKNATFLTSIFFNVRLFYRALSERPKKLRATDQTDINWFTLFLYFFIIIFFFLQQWYKWYNFTWWCNNIKQSWTMILLHGWIVVGFQQNNFFIQYQWIKSNGNIVCVYNLQFRAGSIVPGFFHSQTIWERHRRVSCKNDL